MIHQIWSSSTNAYFQYVFSFFSLLKLSICVNLHSIKKTQWINPLRFLLDKKIIFLKTFAINRACVVYIEKYKKKATISRFYRKLPINPIVLLKVVIIKEIICFCRKWKCLADVELFCIESQLPLSHNIDYLPAMSYRTIKLQI